jgi:hypothetical protein
MRDGIFKRERRKEKCKEKSKRVKGKRKEGERLKGEKGGDKNILWLSE